MKILKTIVLVSLLSVANLFASVESDVEALVDKAYNYCKAEGLEVCTKTFTAKDPAYTKGDLYVFVAQVKGPLLAHGGNANLVGKDLKNVKSPSGVYPGRIFAKAMQSGKDSIWVDYKWSHPITKKQTDKFTYIRRFDDNVFIGCGYYK